MMRRAGGARLALALTTLALAASAAPAGSAILWREDFTQGDAVTGLPRGWSRAPAIHAPYFATARDAAIFGAASPALRVDAPLRTLNYYVASASIAVPRLDGEYTLQVGLRIEMPDSPFAVEVILHDAQGSFAGTARLLDLPGEQMDSLRVYRVSFRPSETVTGAGRLTLAFGLPYSRLLHAGRFWVDDVELREGRETGALEVYARPTTVAGGEPVEICVSAARGAATLTVYHETASPEPVLGPIVLDGLRAEPVPGEAWRRGCGWPAAATIATAGWPSGLYQVRVGDGDREQSAYFTVRGQGGEGPLLVILPSHTVEAYNGWGGGSFYTSPQRPEISFDRPLGNQMIGPYMVPIHLLRWLAREGIGFGVANEDDLNDRPELLYDYPAIALTGHSEYWTHAMREAVEAYVAAGGSVLCLSGNTCWWQTRVEYRTPLEGDTGRILVGYKYAAADDPYWAIDPSLVTGRWDEEPVADPPSAFLGLSWRYGGHVNWANDCAYDWTKGHGGYRVFHTDHWAFAGTGLTEGDTLGQALAIVGYEVDGAPIRWVDGRPEALSQGGTPPGFLVLGQAPCWNYLTVEDGVGDALAGILERGDAFVFNGGTTGWCWGLAGDPQVQRFTRNLIDRAAAHPLPRPLAPALRVVPNPAWDALTLEFPGAAPGARAVVIDLQGRRVAGLDLARVAAGRSQASWNLLDGAGRRVPSGVYWARLADGSSPAARVIVIGRH